MLQKPLSESFRNLRRAQRLLIRRKVRVSFTHSAGSKASSGRITTARGLVPPRPERSDAVPVTWQPAEVDIRNSVNDLNDPGPYSLFPKAVDSPARTPRRSGSPSKHRRGQDNNKKPENCVGQSSTTDDAEGRPYCGALPTSTIRSPCRKEKNQAPTKPVEGQDTRVVDSVEEVPAQEPPSAIKRRPRPIPAPGPQYSLFPKQSYRGRSQSSEKPSNKPDPAHEESVRRGLYQQQTLSALVPSENQNNHAKPLPSKPECSPPRSIPKRKESLAPTAKSRFQHMPLKQLKVLDKFTRELKEFATTTQDPGRKLELVPAPTPSEAHASVRTVQELLPYRQQFQEAGLAITSAEQKVPIKSEKHLSRQVTSSTDGRLQFDGPSRRSSADAKIARDTAAEFPEPGRLVMDKPSGPPRPELSQATERRLNAPPPTQSTALGSHLPSPTTQVKSTSRVARDIRPRLSAVFLMNKPLPARPGCLGPKPPERSRGKANHSTRRIITGF